MPGRKGSGTVTPMPLRPGQRRGPSRFGPNRAADIRRRRIALVLATSLVAVIALLVSAFGGTGTAQTVSAPSSPTRLLPAGPPTPEVVARLGSLRVQLPVSQRRLTAIGYFAGSNGSIALSPLGTQANAGLLTRLLHKLVGGGGGTPRWFALSGGSGPSLSALAIGAPVGSDVYAPVDGTIVGINDVILNGDVAGQRIDIQPLGSPSLVVSVSRIGADPALRVGSAVSASATKLGSILDLSRVERQALARYTNDTGNHALIEVHTAATLQLP